MIYRTVRRHAALLAIVGLLSFAPALSAAIVTIDNFDADTLDPAYAQSNVLNTAGNNAVVTFSPTINADKLTYSYTSSTNNAVQTTLLRDDFVLANDGDYVQLTVALPAFTGTATNILGGLVLDSSSKSPADRNNIYLLQLVGDRSIRAQRGVTTLVNSGTNVFAIGADVILRITRNSATSVTPSYSLDNGANFINLTSGTNPVPHTITGFNALGMFGGSARGNTVATLVYEDLVMNVVPEPTTIVLTLFGLSAIGCWGIRRRLR